MIVIEGGDENIVNNSSEPLLLPHHGAGQCRTVVRDGPSLLSAAQLGWFTHIPAFLMFFSNSPSFP